MNRLLSFIFFFAFFTGQTQTLTQSFNEPVVGDMQTIRRLDTSAYTSGMPLSVKGANSLWDFTKLKPDSFVLITTYDLPSSTSLSAGYPGATVLEKQPGNIYMFMKSVTSPTTQTEVLGFATTSMSTTFSDPAVPSIYPVSMGSSHTDNIAGTYTFSTFSGTCTGKVNTVADGTGTLSLPHGVIYKNVLRVKSTQTITASLGTIKQTIIYFYDTSKKFPILQMNYSSFALAFGSPTITAFVSGDEDSFPVGISTFTPETDLVSVFPNPARTSITIQAVLKDKEKIAVDFVNVLGEKIMSSTLHSSTTTIDISTLEGGLYNMIFTGNNVRGNKKLIVQ